MTKDQNQENAVGKESQWEKAVIDECMRVESCLVSNDPAKTISNLIDWHCKTTQHHADLKIQELERELAEKKPFWPTPSDDTAAIRNAALENIAASWDGCDCDSVGGTLDVGEQLRKQFAALITQPTDKENGTKLYAAPPAPAVPDNIRALIADDAYAMSFQSMGQYRTALLKAIDAAPSAPSVQEGNNKYRKKPVVIDAIQWDGTEAGCQMIKAAFPQLETLAKSGHLKKPEVTYWKIGTLEGGHEVTPGDWIIRGVKGEHYPCKPDVFALTYEPASAPSVAQAELEKDAERYRILRDSKYQLQEDDPCVSDDAFTVFFDNDLDNAVDALKARYVAAIAASTTKEGEKG